MLAFKKIPIFLIIVYSCLSCDIFAVAGNSEILTELNPPRPEAKLPDIKPNKISPSIPKTDLLIDTPSTNSLLNGPITGYKNNTATNSERNFEPELILLPASKDNVTKNIDLVLEPYMQEVKHRLFTNWFPPRNEPNRSTVVLFRVAKNGKLLTCSVIQTSNSASVDMAAFDAVYSSAPFQPLPEKFKNPYIDIQYTFNSNEFDRSKVNNMGYYMRELENIIRTKWKPTKYEQDKKVVLLFRISKEGELLSCSYYKTSGVLGADSAAMDSVYYAKPFFKPLPPEIKSPYVDILFNFSYDEFGIVKYR